MRKSMCMREYYICLSVSLSVYVFICSAAGCLLWFNAYINQLVLVLIFVK